MAKPAVEQWIQTPWGSKHYDFPLTRGFLNNPEGPVYSYDAWLDTRRGLRLDLPAISRSLDMPLPGALPLSENRLLNSLSRLRRLIFGS